MKHFGRLFALLLALAFCLALLPLSAMAETYDYDADVKSKNPWCLNTIIVHYDSSKCLSCDGKPMYFGGVMTRNHYAEYDIIEIDRSKSTFQIRVMTSFLDKLENGTHTFEVTEGSEKGKTFDIIVDNEFIDADRPPATPTDLDGGSDEPDEVLYIGGMSGGGAVSTRGGKAVESEAATGVPASAVKASAQTATVSAVILPENAPSANPATGAAL